MHRSQIYHVANQSYIFALQKMGRLLLQNNNLRLYSAMRRFKAEPAIFTAVYMRVVYKHRTTAIFGRRP